LNQPNKQTHNQSTNQFNKPNTQPHATGGLDATNNPIEDFELASSDIAEAVPLPHTARLPVCVSLNRIGNYLVVRCREMCMYVGVGVGVGVYMLLACLLAWAVLV